MGIDVLGPVTVDGEGSLPPRDRAVLVALVVRRGEILSADQLASGVEGVAVRDLDHLGKDGEVGTPDEELVAEPLEEPDDRPRERRPAVRVTGVAGRAEAGLDDGLDDDDDDLDFDDDDDDLEDEDE